MGKWLAKFINSPETPIQQTDIADSGQGKVIDFQAEAARVKAALSRQGIAVIQSNTLGEVVYWARDETEATKAPQGAVVYTLSELRELARGNPTREMLQQIHEAKRIFNGKVVENSINPFENT